MLNCIFHKATQHIESEVAFIFIKNLVMTKIAIINMSLDDLITYIFTKTFIPNVFLHA